MATRKRLGKVAMVTWRSYQGKLSRRNKSLNFGNLTNVAMRTASIAEMKLPHSQLKVNKDQNSASVGDEQEESLNDINYATRTEILTVITIVKY